MQSRSVFRRDVALDGLEAVDQENGVINAEIGSDGRHSCPVDPPPSGMEEIPGAHDQRRHGIFFDLLALPDLVLDAVTGIEQRGQFFPTDSLCFA